MRTLRRRLPRILVAMSLGCLAGVLLAATPVLADDVTPPSGTLTINDGSGYTNSRQLTLHLPATDDVGVVSVVVSDSTGYYGDPIPYADTLQYTLGADLGDGVYIVSVEWLDAAGNGTWSDNVSVTLDRVGPAIGSIAWLDDPDEADVTRAIGVAPADAWDPIAAVSLSSNGTSWSPPIQWSESVDWHFLDPALGGSPRLGPRTLYVKAFDAAGNASTVAHGNTFVSVAAPLDVSPDVPATGHRITLTPQYPAAVTFPAGTHCYWEIAWGDDRSLYYGDHDETFGFFYTYGAASAGFCEPLSFTLPWMPYPQVLVHFRAETSDGEPVVDEWIGASPDAPIIEPVIDSTSRKITSSSIPLIYVLPEDYTLVLGQPTTYRAYAVGGATFSSHDVWLADFSSDANDLQKEGGTSFTFTPRETGFVTVCLNTDTTKSRRWSACYDPPVRHRDLYRPNTTAPVQRLNAGTAGDRVPVSLTWDGSDKGWGIAKYELDRSVDGGAWRRQLSARTKHLDQALATGHRYRYRVRAIDKYGNVGLWDVGPAFRPATVGDASSSATYSGTWATIADATALGGSLHESDEAGARATFRFTGRDVAWVAGRGPTHGIARVYVGATLVATVDLAAATDAPRRIVFRHHWKTSDARTIRIVVAGTASRPAVDVDGFLVLR